eukprot:scaffold85549_cov22-Cyclotella_meneghiniana.AAC.3
MQQQGRDGSGDNNYRYHDGNKYHNHQQENQHYHPILEQTNYLHQDVNAASSQQQQYYSTMASPTHGNKSAPNPKQQQPQQDHMMKLESSNAEDVLTLSLELERVRTQLATTTQHLSTLQSHNAYLESELHRLHSELEEERKRNSSNVSTLQSKLNGEITRANAAEKDAYIALELA